MVEFVKSKSSSCCGPNGFLNKIKSPPTLAGTFLHQHALCWRMATILGYRKDVIDDNDDDDEVKMPPLFLWPGICNNKVEEGED